MCEQQYRKAAEYFWNNILRHPNWSDKEWEYYKSVHESNGYSIARTAWYIGESVINNGYTIEQILDKLKKIRLETMP